MLKHKISKINLVDLAGSERVIVSGSVGQRLKEANNINKRYFHLYFYFYC